MRTTVTYVASCMDFYHPKNQMSRTYEKTAKQRTTQAESEFL